MITLGEPDFNQNTGAPINTSVDLTNSTLTSAGVPGGVLPVPFVPSAVEYPPNTLAAQIIAAIGRSGLTTTAFAPGGGTIWLDNTIAVSGPEAGSVNAVRDLAGNNLEPNRVNRETQFTILMPGVELDFGDAPSRSAFANGYQTLFIDNGARHTITLDGGPSLGSADDYLLNVDTEADAFAFPDSDDARSDVNAAIIGAGFTIADEVPDERFTIAIDSAASNPGDILSIQIVDTAIVTRTYQLIEAGDTAFATDFGIIRVPGEPSEVLAQRVANTVREDLRTFGVRTSLQYEQGTAEFTVRTIDDENGVGVSDGNGTIPAGIFVRPGTNEVISFLNPLDRTGAEINVTTLGGGLLDAWIDFNGDGDFLDPGEQVLTSEVMLDTPQGTAPNSATIFTPETVAVLGGGLTGTTWARFRISSTGNQLPDGVVIGGEVEDYPVFIAAAVLPVPTGATCVTPGGDCIVDEAPDVNLTPPTNGRLDGVLTGTFDANNPVSFEIERRPANAAADSDPNDNFDDGFEFDPTTGTFSYLPRDDFFGEDFFTYRIIETQTIDGFQLPVRSSVVGTVTITVTPINDPPTAENKSEQNGDLYITTEPTDTKHRYRGHAHQGRFAHRSASHGSGSRPIGPLE